MHLSALLVILPRILSASCIRNAIVGSATILSARCAESGFCGLESGFLGSLCFFSIGCSTDVISAFKVSALGSILAVKVGFSVSLKPNGAEVSFTEGVIEPLSFIYDYNACCYPILHTVTGISWAH